MLCKNDNRGVDEDVGSSVGQQRSDLFTQTSMPTLISFRLGALTSFVQLMAYYRY